MVKRSQGHQKVEVGSNSSPLKVTANSLCYANSKNLLPYPPTLPQGVEEGGFPVQREAGKIWRKNQANRLQVCTCLLLVLNL